MILYFTEAGRIKHRVLYCRKFIIIFGSSDLRVIEQLLALAAECPGGSWVFFGWVCAAQDSKLAPLSKKISPSIDTPFLKWANFLYPVLEFALKLIPVLEMGQFFILRSRKFVK